MHSSRCSVQHLHALAPCIRAKLAVPGHPHKRDGHKRHQCRAIRTKGMATKGTFPLQPQFVSCILHALKLLWHMQGIHVIYIFIYIYIYGESGSFAPTKCRICVVKSAISLRRNHHSPKKWSFRLNEWCILSYHSCRRRDAV